jgi:hypothetical protein
VSPGLPPDGERFLEVEGPYDFDESLRFVPFGRHDPTCRRGPGQLWKAARTPDSPVTLQLARAPGGVAARAWGPGAAWALDRADALAGLRDNPAGFEGQRGRTLRAAARAARPVDSAFGLDAAAARGILASVGGCGPWTVEITMGFVLGDPDAVPVGDLHLPHEVGWALAAEPRADDARMLELLEPFRGNRFRLLRLLLAAGRLHLGRSAR